MTTENGALGLSTKQHEVFLCVSLTVNLCTLWSLAIPAVCRRIQGRCHNRNSPTENRRNLHEDKPQNLCRRFTTNLLFHLAMPICGFVVLFKTDILQNPFLTFDSKFRIVFSVLLGHYAFKTAEVLVFRREVIHYKPLLVHHLVAIMTFATILHFEQNTILGVVGLFLEGNLVFAELGNGDVIGVFSHVLSSRLLKFAVLIGFIPAVVTKALIPSFLIVAAFMDSSADLLKMDYVPLAFFFLGLVFFTAVNVWFFKDTFSEVAYHWRTTPSFLLSRTRIPVATVINHEGLSRLCHAKERSIHVECNNLWGLERFPASRTEKNLNVPEALTLDELSPAVIRTTCIVDNVPV